MGQNSHSDGEKECEETTTQSQKECSQRQKVEEGKKGDDKKGPKPKKLPGFEDESSDTSSVKGKAKDNKNKKDNTQDNTEKPKKERKPRAKKEKDDNNENDKEKKHNTRKVKKAMADVVSDDSFDISDVVSDTEDSFVVNKKKNKNKINNED